ncbi:cation-transporting atpase 13a3, partial [Nannochloropsis oceanica]
MATYGANITDINVPPYSLMVLIEVLKPFFIFQVFSLTIWALQQYYYYMYSILFMTAYAVLANAYGEWKNLRVNALP